jgi:mediator of RNA polymerase II transcription subunit 16
MVNMFKIPVDYSEEAHHDQLVRNSLLQLCLSILNHLGFRGDFQPRSFGGKFAMLTLNVRNIVVLITIASNTPANLKEKLNPLDEPDVVDALAGCAKWGVDLLSWLSDCLFELLDDPEIMAMITDPKRFPELARYLQSKNDVSLHLLLCSSTRGFLSAACRRLLHVESLGSRAMTHFETRIQDPAAATPQIQALHQAYLEMQRAVTSSLVKVQDFERLLASLSRDIQTAYQKSLAGFGARKPSQQGAAASMAEQQAQQLIKKAQTHCELDMLLAANPPPSFREVLVRFFTVSLPAFRAQTDPAKLYFANFNLLEVEDDPRSLAMRRAAGRYIDVFKRVELISGPRGGDGIEGGTSGGDETSSGNGNGNSNGAGGNAAQWRRCVRCAAVMEDVWGVKPGFTFVLAQQRRCACGGNWGLLPRGS